MFVSTVSLVPFFFMFIHNILFLLNAQYCVVRLWDNYCCPLSLSVLRLLHILKG